MSCNEWKTVKLGEVADILSGYAFKTKDFIEEGIPVIKIKNIMPPIIDINDTQYVSDELYNEKEKFALNYNDVLISLTGSNVNQLASAVGKIGRVKLKDKKLLLNQRVGKLYIIDENRCNYDYLYYYLIQPEIRYNLAASAGGSANQANISPSQIKDIVLKLPPLEEQEKIANILSSLDDKIELNNEMNKTLEEMAQGIFKRWFVDFEFPNKDGEPYKSSGGEMVESELGMIPKGWEVKELGDITSINPRESLKKGEESIYVEMANLPLNYARINNYIVKPFSGGTKFRNGDTLLARITPCLENGKTAIVDFLNDGELAFGSTEYIVIRPSILNEYYIYCLARHDEFRNFAIKNMNGSSGRQRVDANTIKQYLIVCPDEEILKLFHKACKSMFKQMKKNDDDSIIQGAIRDTLLPKLMNGEIRVN